VARALEFLVVLCGAVGTPGGTSPNLMNKFVPTPPLCRRHRGRGTNSVGRGIRKYFESPYRPGAKLTVDDFYGWIFEHSVPGLPEAAARLGLSPLAYMRKFGAFLVDDQPSRLHEAVPRATDLEGTVTDPVSGVTRKDGNAVGVEIENGKRVGFPTASRKLEFHSKTLRDWRWGEHAIPGYIRSHVHKSEMDRSKGEMLLLPTFRLPTLIHSRSGNAKWLYEISNRNPLWIHPEDAQRFEVATDLLKVHSAIGYFVDKVWVTEGIRPGIIACSHHLGRWRLDEQAGRSRWASAVVDLKEIGPGKWKMRQTRGIRPFVSGDPDSQRIWWQDAGVHQNLIFPVQPDPVSGQHCRHQKVRLERAQADDLYGDIYVDTVAAHLIYRQWLGQARPAPGPGNLRRPFIWLARVYRPVPEAFYLSDPDR
jgi:hypothetical protein